MAHSKLIPLGYPQRGHTHTIPIPMAVSINPCGYGFGSGSGYPCHCLAILSWSLVCSFFGAYPDPIYLGDNFNKE